MKIILLTGIPGMGKTHIGNYLRDKLGFIHLDMEDANNCPKEFFSYIQTNNFDRLLKAAIGTGKDIVITWGFWPVANDHIIYGFIQKSARIFWLDGDRNLAKRYWKHGHPDLDEILFDNQIQRIDNDDIKGKFSPIPFDTFSAQGKHLSEDEVVKRILEAYEKKN